MNVWWMSPKWNDRLAAEGLDRAEAWWKDDRIKVWRDIAERQNAVLDFDDVRLHVKRLRRAAAGQMRQEVNGIGMLESFGIESTPLVAWGTCSDGRALVVTEDLAGFTPADQWLKAGGDFDRLARPTADLVATLHRTMRHRDLYLCHIFVSETVPGPGDGEDVSLRLIDAARVSRLPLLFWRRWVVKDLAQFRYSAEQVGVSEDALDHWLTLWAEHLGTFADGYQGAVKAKVKKIARHDEKLKKKSPERDVSLPPREPTREGAGKSSSD